MMEVELKLSINPKFKDALVRHPLFSGKGASKPHEQTVSDTYFDTPDLQLRQSDIGLRVRRVNGGWVQNIKSGGTVHGGLHARNEWESPVNGALPELGRLRDVVDDKAIRRHVRDAAAKKNGLAPVFTTNVKRTAWELHPAEGEHIECALDQGRVECGGKNTPINEFELELKSGDPVHLFDLALALQKDIPLQIASKSKADRGYALLDPTAPAAIKATRLELKPAMSVEQAFQEIAFNTLAHIQDNADGVAERHDVESLHQMRVGMRRLRSALSMYKRLLRLPADLQQELDWLATELGDARDWDVLAGSTLPAVAQDLPDPTEIDSVQGAAKAKAGEHHVAAAAAVGSPRYTHLMLAVSRWVQAAGWQDDEEMMNESANRLAQPVTKFARATLKRDQRRLRARADGLSEATPEARHRVRIAAKKTRYAAEFFGSLFSPGKVQPYIKSLTGLQDELGFLNDATVADRLLSDLPAAQPDLTANVGFVRGFLAARTTNDDRTIIRLWKRFERIGIPR
ncbi:MAG: CHAD domain-containing protein [Pseudomonadota bacterium]